MLAQFVSGLPADRADLVRRLDRLILGVHPGFDVAIKYGLLMYAIEADWRHWVVSIDGRPRTGVGLRFLFGVMLSDGRRVLRAGTSVLKTWDLASGAALDEAAVTEYVAEAVRLYPEYRSNEQAILAKARAGAASRPVARTHG